MRLISTLVVLLGLPCCHAQEDNGWPAWPVWPAWPEGDWPEWPEWPPWQPSQPAAAPAPVSFEEEAAVTVQPTEQQVQVEPDFATVVDFLSSREDLGLFLEIVTQMELSIDFSDPLFVGTLFVPTDTAIVDAFAALGVLSFEELREAPEAVMQIVDYHIIPGVVAASFQLQDGQMLRTALGRVFKVEVDLDDGVAIKGLGSSGNVVLADQFAGGSIVHVIDTVLLPFDPKLDVELGAVYQDLQVTDFETVSQVTGNMESLSLFHAGLQAAEIGPLSEAPNFVGTIFVPTNEAIESLVQTLGLDSAEQLLSDMALLQTVLIYHILPQALTIADFEDGQEITTLEGDKLTIDAEGFFAIGGVGSDAEVVFFDIMAGEVVMHIIDNVLLPFEVTDDMIQVIQEVAMSN